MAAGIATIDVELNLCLLQDGRIDGKTVTDLRLGSDGLIYGITGNGDLFTEKDDITMLSLKYFGPEENREET